MNEFEIGDSSVQISEKVATKKAAKDFLRNKYGLTLNKKRLLLSIIIDEKQLKKGDTAASIEFVETFLEAAKSISVSVILMVPESYKEIMHRFNNPRGVFVVSLEEKTKEKVLEASDVSFVFPLSEMTTKHLQWMWSHGVIPISKKARGIEDYNPNHETGNSFMVRKENIWSVFAALVRATETYRFPYDWKHIISQALSSS